MKFYSQCGEDAFIARNQFRYNLPPEGTFIEVGAGDGLEFSNTAHFEFERGWKGLVVEPNPDMERSLRLNRKCKIEVCAVGSETGPRRFMVHEDPLLSGFLRTEGKQIIVPTWRLDHLMGKHGIKTVDLLSIDTEGTEVDVLRSAGDRLKDVKLILAENGTMGIGDTREELIQFLKQDYWLIHTFPWNLLFMRKAF